MFWGDFNPGTFARQASCLTTAPPRSPSKELSIDFYLKVFDYIRKIPKYFSDIHSIQTHLYYPHPHPYSTTSLSWRSTISSTCSNSLTSVSLAVSLYRFRVIQRLLHTPMPSSIDSAVMHRLLHHISTRCQVVSIPLCWFPAALQRAKLRDVTGWGERYSGGCGGDELSRGAVRGTTHRGDYTTRLDRQIRGRKVEIDRATHWTQPTTQWDTDCVISSVSEYIISPRFVVCNSCN